MIPRASWRFELVPLPLEQQPQGFEHVGLIVGDENLELVGSLHVRGLKRQLACHSATCCNPL